MQDIQIYVTDHHPEPQGNGQVNTHMQYSMINRKKKKKWILGPVRKQTESDPSAWVGMGKVLNTHTQNADQMQRTLKAFK